MNPLFDFDLPVSISHTADQSILAQSAGGGKPATRTKAVAACKSTTGADVIVTGDAREGDWRDLRTALEAAHVPIYARLGTVSP